MKMLKVLLLFFLIVVLTSPVLAWGGFMVGVAWNSGNLTGWRRLPDPPARPVQIAGGSTAAVLVTMADGQVFYCRPLEDGECWVKYEEAVFTNESNEYCEQWPVNYAVKAAPGEVIDYLKTQWCHFEAGEETDYALLEDGSVWMWHHFDANYLNLTRTFGLGGAGCCLGVLASIVLSIFIWRVSRARQVHEQIQDK